MLKQRIITAILLIPLIVGGILYLPTLWLSRLLLLIIALAAWEWFNIIGFTSTLQKGGGTAFLVLTLVITALLPEKTLFALTLVVWGGILLVIGRYAHAPLPAAIHRLILYPYSALLLICTVLALFFHSVVVLHGSAQNGALLLLQIVVLVWLADTGGYFAGKRWGKTALAREISPNKTWEGVWGAIVLCLLWTLTTYYPFFTKVMPLLEWIMVAVIAVLISIVGDLFESLFKRSFHVKDSGNLLPGHGGILDRIDSLIAAVPVFSAMMYFLGVPG